jgi:hypothetical protein
MSKYHDLLSSSTSFLLIDWPSRDVPDTLARHGFSVIALDGSGVGEYNTYQMSEGEVAVRPAGGPPSRVDIVYAHRPVAELESIVEQARSLNARAVWLQSGLDGNGSRNPRGCWLPANEAARAKQMVESAEMDFLDSPYLADAVREVVRL